MIKEEIRGENCLLPVNGSNSLAGSGGARAMANVFVRDVARNRLELWQACPIAAGDPSDDFFVDGGREFLRKTVFSQTRGQKAPLDVWLRIS